MATWPATLPKPLLSGYAISPLDQTIRTDMETGAARQRRRTTQRLDQITAAWRFTDAQYQTFRDWFDNASTGAAGGAAWFSIDLAVGAGGIDTKEARFTGPCKAEVLPGLHWHVAATLEVR